MDRSSTSVEHAHESRLRGRDLRTRRGTQGLTAGCGTLGPATTLPPQQVIVVVDHNARLFARARRGIGDGLVIENSRAKGLGVRETALEAATTRYVAFDGRRCDRIGALARTASSRLLRS